ncbi:MAG: glycosyltransferase family 39 protein, partial [Patescibacteria group bacterium]
MTIVLLILGGVWIALNIFFLPFYPWTEGLHRPWLILNGLVPYRDFIWIRTPLDIFLLSLVYKIVGVSEFAYQAVIFVLHLFIGLLLFFGLRTKSLRLAITSYIFYTLLLFPLFINTEIGEILVSFFVLATFFLLLKHTERNKMFWLFLAGITHSLAVLTKQTSFFSVIAVLLWYAVRCSKQSMHCAFKDFLCGVGIYGSGLLLPIAVFWRYLMRTDAFGDFIHFTISFNLFVYSSWSKPWGIVGGSRMIGIFLSILLFHFTTTSRVVLNQSGRLLLYVLISGLFPALFPSFWSYRLITAFPLISILGGEMILSVRRIIGGKKQWSVPKIIVVGFCSVLFLFGLWNFVKEYGIFVKDNGLG